MSKLTNPSRRAFIQRASALSIAGAAAPWALNLAAMAEAAAANAQDYKALVCVFLYGGNDYANTLVPYDSTSYNAYSQLRPTLAYARDKLSATLLTPKTVPLDRNGQPHHYALAPELASLLPYFDNANLATVLNLGTLIEPTTKQQYTNKSVALPPKLFSHNDQQSFWQSSASEGATSGWGGRIGDLFEAGNGNATFTCVNVSGNAVYLSGNSAVQYQVSTNGPVALSGGQSLFGSGQCAEVLKALMTQSSSRLFENEYARISQRAMSAQTELSAALSGAPALTTVFPDNNSLAAQLKMVARMISCASAVGAKRQVFFVSLGGFDNHDGLLDTHPQLLSSVAAALDAFYKATIELGVSQQVTSFTASDFGRTLSGNNDGSDHGWGSMHFVLGGAVKGKQFYGTAPLVAVDSLDDVGQGRLLPSTAVDQYAATLASWLGLSDSQILEVLPNLAHFDASQRKLGFL